MAIRGPRANVAGHGAIKDDRGKLKCLQQVPQVAIANKLAQALTRLEQEFGMTPSARSRINVQPAPIPSDPNKARFFKSG